MNVLVVDMIEGFTRIGALASPRVEALIPKQADFLSSLSVGSFVVFACDSHFPEDPEFKRMPVHCLVGTEESEICPELIKAVGDREYTIVPKRTHSAFFGTNLDEIIAGRGDDWVVIGCVTDVCIIANVIELDYRGKNVIVYRDLVDTYEITPDQSLQMCGSMVKEHNPYEFNRLFFDRYLPGVWGVEILEWSDQ